MVTSVGSWRLRVVVRAVSLLGLGVLCSSAQAAVGYGITYDSQRSDAAGQAGIWMMNSDGTGQRGFIPGGSEASWSADGTHLIYETGTTHCTTQSGGGLVLANADGTNPQQLAGVCGDARLSPDGTTVAYESAADSLSVLSVAHLRGWRAVELSLHRWNLPRPGCRRQLAQWDQLRHLGRVG
jgi:hypothetical protein